MTFTQAVKAAYSANIFPGRASRSEYWWFALFQVLILAAVFALLVGVVVGLWRFAPVAMGPSGWGSVAAGLLPALIFYTAVAVNLVPGLAVAARRLHDRDLSALWLFLVFFPLLGPIALIVLFCLPGTPGPNRFGADPASGASVF